ncbi:DUF1540 domain-containing protein [Amedibacillus sp. YH-ame10]
MQKKTEILCSVANCVYHKDAHCEAETISVACDNCVIPNSCCETECNSFRNKNER